MEIRRIYTCLLFRTIDFLLKFGADGVKLDKQGYLPLHYAALNGHSFAIEMVSSFYFHFRFHSHYTRIFLFTIFLAWRPLVELQVGLIRRESNDSVDKQIFFQEFYN